MKKVTRREFVRIGSLTAAATVAAACAQPTATAVPATAAPAATVVPAATAAPAAAATTAPAAAATAAPAATDAPAAAKFSEAPMLADMVASGDIPAVDERLPENPDVMPVCEMVGKYGGTMRRGFKGVSDKWGPTKLVGNNLTWYNLDLTVRASLAESWEVNDDASEWTWNLRKGTKWSDGSEFTTADFMYYYDHQLLNEDLTSSPPGNYSTGNPLVLAEWTAVDDYTLVMSFQDPNPLFAFRVIGHQGQPFRPAEYMKQYHPDFTDMDTLVAMAKESGFDTWDKNYLDRDNWYMASDRPSLYPWIPTNSLSEELFVMTRNPYFWQVDEIGQQLPYIDEVTHRLFETPDVFNMWILNGEIDFQGRHVDAGNITLFKESEDAGDYEVVVGQDAVGFVFTPNQACKDLRMREFLGNRDVRIAFSLAVNRDELNELVYNGLGTPRQHSPLSSSPQSYPKQANVYLDYDPDEASALLDGAGYAEKDGEGYRLWNDGSGETISITIEGTAQAGSQDEDAISTIIKYFGDVGVKCQYKYVERSLYTEHYESNSQDAVCWGAGRSVMPIVTPQTFIGQMPDRPWAGAFGLWKLDNNNPNGEEPPADHFLWDIWDIMDQILVEADDDKRTELFFGILDIWAEELPMVGYLGEFPKLIIKKKSLRNYLPGYPVSDITKDEHVLGSQTLFWE